MEKNYKTAEIKAIQLENGQLKLTLSVDRGLWENRNSELEVTIPVNEINSKYKLGDLLKFEEENPEILAKIPTDNMDYTEFNALQKRISTMTCEQLISTHQSLIGKTDNKGYIEGDLYSYYISQILNKECGHAIVKDCEPEVIKFINSKHVSDYFKSLINQKVKNKKLTNENMSQINMINGAINSEKNIAEFNENEFGEIYRFLQNDDNYDYSDSLIIALAFKLNSEGAIAFLNNQVDPMTVIKRIVETSGLSKRAEYYSGRGANLGDMNDTHLTSIYQKLARLDEKKALGMARLAMEMPTLGATEFIESLYRLACNGYNNDNTNISNNNYSFGNARGDEMVAIGMAMISTAFSRGSGYDYTEIIRRKFITSLPKELIESFEDKSSGISL